LPVCRSARAALVRAACPALRAHRLRPRRTLAADARSALLVRRHPRRHPTLPQGAGGPLRSTADGEAIGGGGGGPRGV